ncbi:unnamed protein product, partial [Mesorhabditis spiculigera]
MCAMAVLIINGFYQTYYWMFDLIEHVLVSLLILILMLIFFLPLWFKAEEDPSRPLFTIFVLLVGVVGGLTLVITVVYFYRFCLKKRPPLTTTGKPEQKRDAVRSEAAAACRPLPLPLRNALYQTQPTIARVTQVDKFRNQAVVQKETLSQQSSTHSQNLPILTYTTDEYGRAERDGHQQPIHRNPSAELLPPDSEYRRTSVDPPKRRRLPSTEHLEVGRLLLFWQFDFVVLI